MDSPCTVTPARIRDTEAGFDRDQRQEMDSLRRDKLSNVDYWKRIYGILFQIPENSSEIPSPCEYISEANRTCIYMKYQC